MLCAGEGLPGDGWMVEGWWVVVVVGRGNYKINHWLSATASGWCVQRQAVSRRTAGASTQDPESGLGHAVSYAHAATACTLHPLCRRTDMKGSVCSQSIYTVKGAICTEVQARRYRYIQCYSYMLFIYRGLASKFRLHIASRFTQI